MKSLYTFFLIYLVWAGSLFAGNYPFPQNVNYVYGIKPTTAKHQDALKSHNSWKSIYVVDAGPGRKRVLFGDVANSTVSEGIAYGMLISAYADDKVVFDGLWNYYKAYRNVRGVMNWKIRENGTVEGSGGATDAEEDAAMALIIANYQWGSNGTINYMSDAIALINAIMTHEVAKPSYMLKAGDQWGNADVTNPSYFAPAYYRIFYQLTGDAQWLQVLEKCYTILSLNAHPVTGLVTDWCRENGTQTDQSWQRFDYFYDASRFPWRMANDYLWFGEPRAKDYCTKIANFIKNTVGGSTKIVDGYTLAGAKVGTTHNSTFVGTFALTAMVDASFQAHLNASYADNVKTLPDGYFSQMLHTVSMFMLTGNFYRLPPPVCKSFNLGPDLSLCTSASYTLDPQISPEGRNFRWNTGATTPTITAGKKGRYILRIDSAGCLRSDTIDLLGLDVNMGSDIEILVGDSVILDARSSGAGVTYLWNTGEISKTIVADSGALYWVEVDSAGCKDRDTIFVNYQKSEDIKLYPNPNAGRFKVILFDATIDRAEVSVYTTQGKMIFKNTISNITTGEPLTLDLSSLSSGMYILRVETKNARRSKKFIKY